MATSAIETYIRLEWVGVGLHVDTTVHFSRYSYIFIPTPILCTLYQMK